MITIGKYKQGEIWIEGQKDAPCLELCHKDKLKVMDGYLTLPPANIQFIALNKATKCSILPAKQERIVVTYILIEVSILHPTSMFYSPSIPAGILCVSSLHLQEITLKVFCRQTWRSAPEVQERAFSGVLVWSLCPRDH